MFRLSKNSKRNLRGVRKEILLLLHRAIKRSPHDFGVPNDGGKRTAERQGELYELRPKVTWCDGYIKLSYHQSGNAFDIFIYDEHGACWKCIHKYKEVAEIIRDEFNLMWSEGIFKEDEQIYWGGDWNNPDRPHFEIKRIKQQ